MPFRKAPSRLVAAKALLTDTILRTRLSWGAHPSEDGKYGYWFDREFCGATLDEALDVIYRQHDWIMRDDDGLTQHQRDFINGTLDRQQDNA